MYSSESRCAGLQLLAIFVGALTNHASSQNSNLRPNIVVIMADDLGYNDVSYHGSEIWTPNIDQLAVLGVRLENYYVAPQCGPSRAQFLSGRYNIHTGTQHSNFSPCRPSGLPLEYPTMAEEMKKLDYTTHMIGKWHLGHHREENLPTNRGFDTFRGMLLGSGDHYTHAKNYGGRPAYDLHEGTQPFNKTFGRYSTHVFTRRAENIIQQYGANQTQPLFMWLSYQAPHTPVQVPEKYEQQFDFIPDRKRRVFAGMVAALDEGVGSVVDALKRAGIYDNTLIVFTTDNGGQASSGSSNYPLKGNKNTFYEAGVRGVGFVSGPILSRSGVSDELTHITDWMPTLLHMAGADTTALEIDGVNQWDSINTGSLTPREEVLLNIDVLELSSHESSQSSVFDTRIQAGMRWHDWKLLTGDPGYHLWVPQPQQDYSLYSSVTNMITNRAAEQNETVFLYNLRMDPYEQFNLVNVMPEIAMEMLSKLAAYQNTSIPSHNPPLDIRCNPHRNGHFWGPYISTGSRSASRNQSPSGQRNRQRSMFSSTTTPRDFGQGLDFGGLDSDGSIGGDMSRKRPSNNGGRGRNNNRNNIFIGDRDTV